jgi:hypothetical protein
VGKATKAGLTVAAAGGRDRAGAHINKETQYMVELVVEVVV